MIVRWVLALILIVATSSGCGGAKKPDPIIVQDVKWSSAEFELVPPVTFYKDSKIELWYGHAVLRNRLDKVTVAPTLTARVTFGDSETFECTSRKFWRVDPKDTIDITLHCQAFAYPYPITRVEIVG